MTLSLRTATLGVLTGFLCGAWDAQGLDIGNYSVRQANKTYTYTIPAGTAVSPGGYVIVGRGTSKGLFETNWGVVLGTNVVYLNSSNTFPRIDGSETFTLRNASSTTIDGPTPASIDPLNKSVQRISAIYNATNASSWNVVSYSAATPGAGGAGNGTNGLVISEYSDANAFSNEFIEMYYDYLAANGPPVLLAIENKIVTISNALEFAVTAIPTDGDAVTLTASNLPAGAVFSSTDENGWFSWTNASPLGVYTTRFYAADYNGTNFASVVIGVLPAPTVSFLLSEATVFEDVGTQMVQVVLSRSGSATVQVSAAGTALPGTNADYSLSSTTLVFMAGGATQMTVSVVVSDDSSTEGLETVILNLAQAMGALIGSPATYTLSIRDNDAITIMTANLVTGSDSKYYDPGTRIMRGLKPDIVGIQEWKITNASFRNFVDVNFGTNFSYYIEPQATNYFPIPNGIVSRWPMKASGEWADPMVVNRDFAWATIDIPGDRDLHVVCIHLYSSGTDADRAEEAGYVTNLIATAGWPANDYVVICGDLNLVTRTDPAMLVLTNIVSDIHKPADQNGDTDSNSNRTKPFDYVLPAPSLNSNNWAVTVGGWSFPDGIVFDSRLWTNPPTPILTNDSAAVNADHMAVMKAFSLGKTPPSLAAIPAQRVTVGGALEFIVHATPTDGDTVTLTASNLPSGASFNSTNENGTFTWASASPVGAYTSIIYAADMDGLELQPVIIQVLVDGTVWINEIHYDNASIDTNEGVEVAGTAGMDLRLYSLWAYNGGDGAVYMSNYLSGVVDDEGCGYGAAWFPIAGLQNETEGIALVYDQTNVVQFISYEGVVVAVDGPAIELSSSQITAEAGTELNKSLQLIGSGTNASQFAWAGPTNTASPGVLNSRQVIYPCGVASNQPPVLDPIGPQTVVWSNTLVVSISAQDVDANPITLSVSNAPAGSLFGATNGNGTLTWPNASPLGVCTSVFYATTTNGSDSESVVITVSAGLEPPVLQPIGDKTVIAGVPLAFNVLATDAESEPITLTVSNAPADSTFASTNGEGSFAWSAPTQGVYNTLFYAADIHGVDWEAVKITVTPATNRPVLQAIGNKTISEAADLLFSVTATDADGETITLTASNLPAGATFASTNGNGAFTWTNASPVGIYTSAFFAADNDGVDSEQITIHVLAGGSLWINEIHYDNTGAVDVVEGVEVAGASGIDLGSYSIISYNGNGGVTYKSNALSGTLGDERCGYGAAWFPIADLQNGPDGIALVQNGSNVVMFLSYEGAFTASNGPAAGSVSLDIKVAETTSTPTNRSLQLTGIGNDYIEFTWAGPTNAASPGMLNALQTIYPCNGATNPPVLAAIGNKNATVSNIVSFPVTASDTADGDVVTLWATNVPVWASFPTVTNAGTVTNLFIGTPSNAGVFSIYFFAGDRDGTNSKAISINVAEAALQTNYIVTFEGTGETKTTYASDDVTLSGLSWNLTDALIGTLANDRKNGVRAARIQDTNAVMTMQASIYGTLTNLSFYYGKYGTDGNSALASDYSADDGSNWVNVGTVTVSSTNLTLYSTNIQVTGNVRIRIRKTVSISYHANVDDIQLSFGSATPANPDTDGDGLPNDWETAYFNGITNATATDDSDGDGADNWSEFVANTIPTNLYSCFVLWPNISETQAQVEFESSTNRSYKVYVRTDLVAGGWAELATNIAGSGGIISITISNSDSLYYRSKVIMP